MSKRYLSISRLPAAFITTCLWLNGCVHPTTLPGLKQIADRSEVESAKYTAEALKKSPDLQKLDHLCTKEIPLFDGFVLSAKEASSPRYTSLNYTYRSSADYRKVKSYYIDYFTKNGWQIKENREGSWGPRWIGRFRKDSFEVVIQHGGMVDVDYAFDCEKLSASGEALPNNAMQPTAK